MIYLDFQVRNFFGVFPELGSSLFESFSDKAQSIFILFSFGSSVSQIGFSLFESEPLYYSSSSLSLSSSFPLLISPSGNALLYFYVFFFFFYSFSIASLGSYTFFHFKNFFYLFDFALVSAWSTITSYSSSSISSWITVSLGNYLNGYPSSFIACSNIASKSYFGTSISFSVEEGLPYGLWTILAFFYWYYEGWET